jgi:hypothetical protein
VRIALLLIKNTSTLDYTLPLLRRIRAEQPEAELSVFYAVSNRSKILRRSTFYSRFLKEHGIEEVDLLDLGRGPRQLRDAVRSSSVWNWWDRQPIRGPLDLAVAAGSQLGRFVEAAAMRALGPCDPLAALRPDIVLFDNRTLTRVPGRDRLYAYLDRRRPLVALLPHAPHQTTADAFIPFDAERGRTLASYCDYWMPFSRDEAWVNAPEHRERFAYTGYPGLDDEWLTFLRGQRPRGDGPRRGLFIIREFRGLGSGRPQDDDPYILEAAEFERYCRLVEDARSRLPGSTQIILKPHPSNNQRTFERSLRSLGISDWTVTYESIYDVLPDVDFVVSLYSTTLLIPAMAGIPVTVLNTRMQEVLHRWDAMREMYGGLRFFLEDPDALPAVLPDVARLADERRAGGAYVRDRDHLRRFYPDGAIDRCLERLALAPTRPLEAHTFSERST